MQQENITGNIPAELKTLRDYLRWGLTQFNQADLFYGHGTDNAWDDIVNLVLTALDLPFDLDKALLAARLTSTEKQMLYQLITQRVLEKKPTAYLTNHSWFANLPFYVDERVIIPRSPIAELINNGFSPWLVNHEVTDILDLCTGSGCIAIACAYVFPECNVDAVDISEDALEVAAINVKKHDLTDRVKLIQSDLFAEIPRNKHYDLIVSNPPYVSESEYTLLPAEYHHEPRLALEAKASGLAVVEHILQDAEQHMKAHGILVIEVGNTQTEMENKYPDFPFLWLEFSHGGRGIFLMTKEQLIQFNKLYK